MRRSIHIRSLLRGFLTGVNFLTIIPARKGIVTEEEVGFSAAFFPAIGALLGLFLILVDAILCLVLPREVRDLFLIVILIFLTGAIHLDGLADTIDGFFSRKQREGILEVMRDSRIGTMGAMGIFSVLMVKFVCLNNIPLSSKSVALVMMPLMGRWSMVHLALVSSYARQGTGTGKVFCEKVRAPHWLFAFATSIIAGIVLMGWKGPILMTFILLLATLLHRYSRKKIGGVTGDVFGASCEFHETMTLIFLLLLRA